MGTDIKRRKIKRLKGSVLFTTLVVMILVLLIMLTAIGLAGAASKKAYSTWYDNQTKYTAQDLVDNVVGSLAPGQPNEILGGTIIAGLGSKGSHVDVSVAVNGTDSIPGYGQVSPIRFEYVADNGSDYTIPGLSGHDNERIIKVSASVTMGGETSTYSTYVVGNALGGKTDGNGGGYIALSNLKGGSGSNDAPGTVGRFYAGIESKIPSTAAGNQTIDAGDVFINTDDYYFNACKNDPAGIILGRNDPDHGYYGGMRVTGDLRAQNGIIVQSQYPPSYITDMTSEKFYNIPYLYVDGKIEMNNTGISIKGISDDKPGMLNLYCGNFNFTGHSNLTGCVNVMTMSEGVDNNLKMNGSTLTDWATTTFTGVSNKGSSETGNFYCKGNFIKSGNGMEINGDLCVVGNLNVQEGELTVKNGNVYVGGTITNEDKIKIDAGRKIVSVGASNTATFLQNVRNLSTTDYPDAQNAATRFETAYKLKADGANGISYVQTLDNIKAQFKDSSDPHNVKYVGVVDASGYTGTDKWDGTSVITKSCVWDSTLNLGAGTSRTIYINPGPDEVWINIDPSLKTISNALIIVDDSQGGSAKFFIEDGATTLDLKMTRIVTKTYNDMLYGGTMVPLCAYPDKKYVPQIFMYAATGNNVHIKMSDGNYMFTGDMIAPDATFEAQSTNGVKKTVDYTYFTYLDMDGDGVVSPSEQANPVNVNREMDLCFLGSLEVGEIDVNNQFGYIYVDDPPAGTGIHSISGGFSWTTIDGYSTY